MAACFLAVALSAGFVVSLQHRGAGPHLLWMANGVMLAYLLVAPRWRWPAYLSTGCAAQWVSCSLMNGHWKANSLYALLNLIEVALSAWLLRRRSSDLPRFSDPAYAWRFVRLAVVAGPAVAGLLFAPVAMFLLHAGLVRSFLTWAIGDGLGTAVTAPACVGIFLCGLRGEMRGRISWIYAALFVLITVAGFSQSRVPLLFLLYPLLVLILLQMGMAWAAVGAMFVSVLGSYSTLHGRGPLLILKSLSPEAPIVLLQLFMLSGMFMLYTISVVLDRQKLTEKKLRETVRLYELVTKNSRDVIILSDRDGNRRYVSAAAQTIGGWTPEQLLRYRSMELVHPEDVPQVEKALDAVRKGEDGAMIQCRVRKQDGDYVWVETSLRQVRDPATGIPLGMLNVVRDIQERKQAEQDLQSAYQALEALAGTDPLTRLANRRSFDQKIAAEWRRGMRGEQPLSLLLMDADFFKLYNDNYGHVRGDSCLRQIAEVAMDAVRRPGDLVARFGGEEFAVILPNTPSEGARSLAEEICAALRMRQIPHLGNPSGYMTISIGCATLVPQVGQHAITLVRKADEALYEAKRQGRNRVCSATPGDTVRGVLPAGLRLPLSPSARGAEGAGAERSRLMVERIGQRTML